MGKSERQSKVFTDHSGSIHNYIFLKSKNQQESIQLHVWENFNNILIYIFSDSAILFIILPLYRTAVDFIIPHFQRLKSNLTID